MVGSHGGDAFRLKLTVPSPHRYGTVTVTVTVIEITPFVGVVCGGPCASKQSINTLS